MKIKTFSCPEEATSYIGKLVTAVERLAAKVKVDITDIFDNPADQADIAEDIAAETIPEA